MSLATLLIGAILLLAVMAYREDALVDTVVEAARAETPCEPGSEDDVLAIMAYVHRLVTPRLDTIARYGHFVPAFIRSTDANMQQPSGHCGSYVHVCGRALQRAGYSIRIGQMLVGSTWGGHIVLFVRVDGREIVIDPRFNLAFRGADGQLLSFTEIQRDWDSLSKQCPPDYDPRFRYEGVRYTNWRGLPVDWMGNWVREISIRPLLLNLYRVWAIVAGAALLLVVFAFVVVRRREVRSRQSKRYRTRFGVLQALIKAREG